MTVIMGINLCDRICLVADTRVSVKDPVTGEFSVKHDNMMKILPLEGMQAVIACAGDAKLCSFTIRKLQNEYKDKTIKDLLEGIEVSLQKIGDEYGRVDNTAYANFLFAGVDESQHKVVRREKLDAVMASEHFSNLDITTMRTVFAQGIEKSKVDDQVITLPNPATVLFGASIDLKSGINITESEWGDVLVSGPDKITSEEVGDEDVAKLEFPGRPVNDSMDLLINDNLICVAIASSLAEKHDWQTVGGAYVPMQFYDSGKLALMPRRYLWYDPSTEQTEEIASITIENNRYYRVDGNGAHHRLTKVSDIKTNKDEVGSLQI